MTAVRDSLWIWGHEAGSQSAENCEGQWGPIGPSRVTPAEAAHYMGIPNCIMVVYRNRPAPPFDQEALALDVIKAVGPKGHYLNQPHTRENLRKFEFAERGLRVCEGDKGNKSIEFACEKTEWILENHHPQPLGEDKHKELKRILETADKELAE